MHHSSAAALLPNLDAVPQQMIDRWRADAPTTEQARITRFQSANRVRQYIAGRQLLRSLLRHQQGIDPIIETEESGAPRIAGSNLFCSISHSGSAVLVAYSQTGRIGVDIEMLRERDYLKLVEHYFHASEISAFNKLPESARQQWFYERWVRKEAHAKASGEGITLRGLRKQLTEESRLVRLGIPGYAAAIMHRGTGQPTLLAGCVCGEGKLRFSFLSGAKQG